MTQSVSETLAAMIHASRIMSKDEFNFHLKEVKEEIKAIKWKHEFVLNK